MATHSPDFAGDHYFAKSEPELSTCDRLSDLFSKEGNFAKTEGVAVTSARAAQVLTELTIAYSANEADKRSDKVSASGPESMDQRIQRNLGADVYNHLSKTDKDWDWLIAHEDQLARGLMSAAAEGNFHAFMTEVNRMCPHILFENNPRPASRPVGEHLDYLEPAAADWLIKMERGFLRPNDRLVNYVQWQDYTTNISR